MPVTAEPNILSLLPPGRLEFVPAAPMTEDEFFDLCQEAEPLQLERDANGTIIVMPPAGSYSSNRSNEISSQLRNWTRETDQGVAFDSSGGFTLPNGATRAPDAAWVARSRLETLPKDVKEKFLPLAPDFAVEVRSQSDRRSDLEAKMQEYVDNGTRLAWLVDPSEESVAVYREDGTVEVHEHPDTLAGEPVLPDFVCELERVWNPNY